MYECMLLAVDLTMVGSMPTYLGAMATNFSVIYSSATSQFGRSLTALRLKEKKFVAHKTEIEPERDQNKYIHIPT